MSLNEENGLDAGVGAKFGSVLNLRQAAVNGTQACAGLRCSGPSHLMRIAPSSAWAARSSQRSDHPHALNAAVIFVDQTDLTGRMIMSLTFTQTSINLRRVQWRRRLTLAVLALGVAFSLPFVCAIWLHTNPLLYAQIEHVGILLIFIAVFGRTWCTLYIGGQKKAVLVDIGPYSVVRNPLYVFSLIGAAGIGAQTSSLVVALLCLILTAAVLGQVVLKEEAFLRDKFGPGFDAYTKRVPRFLPRFSNFRDVNELLVSPRLVARTFIESSYFLIAIPVIDLIELGREYGWFPDLFHLP